MSTVRYEGAGVAIVTMDHQGDRFVLLGKRLHKPGKGQWSFPGGQRDLLRKRLKLPLGIRLYDYSQESPAETACRECTEELTLWKGQQPPVLDDVSSVWKCVTPVFRWETFLWSVKNPDLLLPCNGRTPEFSTFGWYRLDEMPEPVHFGVRPAVRNTMEFVVGAGRSGNDSDSRP